MRQRLLPDELIGLRGCEQDAHFGCGEHSAVHTEVLDTAVQVRIDIPIALSNEVSGSGYGSGIRLRCSNHLSAVDV